MPVTQAFHAALGHSPHAHRLCLWHTPAAGAPRALAVHVHAFAEEMNKSRRMAAQQALALARNGFAVLQFDLLGCGDSDGEFADASWQRWIDDVVAACALAQQRCSASWPGQTAMPAWLWGHRAGCLLACAAADRLPQPWNLLLWQPTLTGRTVLQQFLRIEQAAALVRAQGSASRGAAKAALAAGQRVEVAGYELDPTLTRGLEAARLAPPSRPARVEWLDMLADGTASVEPSPATAIVMQEWAQAGWALQRHTAVGPMFWQTTEIEEAPNLVDATLAALAALAPAATPSAAGP